MHSLHFHARQAVRSWQKPRLHELRTFCSGLARSVKVHESYRQTCLSGYKYRGLHVNSFVAEALRQKKPVVALESTIITHGMPYPLNVNTAIQVEKIIQDNGAIPATVGIIEGELIVGLSHEEIEFLGNNDDSKPKLKVSRRDMAVTLSQGLSGGTTVSGTMLAAHKAGIQVFVTGGIGGVHRGASQSFDISADLTELGKTPVAVICAGIKSILDIGSTLEYLETQGVTVVTFGENKEFPAFFTSKSGHKAPYNFATSREIAKLIDLNHDLGLNSGMVIGVPIPEKSSAAGEEIEAAINKALEEAKTNKILGKDVTPYILEKVRQLTDGKSLESNIALIENNARVGSTIAVELSKLSRQEFHDDSPFFRVSKVKPTSFAKENSSSKKEQESSKNENQRPVVIGGSIFDLMAITNNYDVLAEVTNQGKLYQSFGGVGRNIAECLARLDYQPLLISAIGEDTQGTMIMENLQSLHMDTRGILTTPDTPTASYSSILNNGGELLMGVGDMDIHDELTPFYIQDFEDDIRNAPIVCIDGNISVESIEFVLKLCLKYQVPVWYEPTDISKATKPFTTDVAHAVTYASPNKRELQAIHAAICKEQEGMLNFNSDGPFDFTGPSEEHIIATCIKTSQDVLTKVKCLVVTLGRYGVLVLRDELCDDHFPFKQNFRGKQEKTGLISATHYPSASEDILPPANVRSVSGAGDSLVGAMIASILRGDEPHMCVKAGIHAAVLSLQSHHTISDQICSEKFTRVNIEDWMTWSPRDLAV